MTVGRVIQGRRASDPGQPPRPLQSGELFVSKDGTEMIALIDEPPAAARRVLAAWRRILPPAGSIEPSVLFGQLEAKYGKPPPMQLVVAGTYVTWHSPEGSACRNLYQASLTVPLSQTWGEDTPSSNDAPIVSLAAKAPPLPGPLYDPLAGTDRQWTQCGPFLTVEVLPAEMTRDPRDQIDLVLSDIGPYVAAFAKNRATTPAGSAPSIKF